MSRQAVSFTLDGQLFGLPVEQVRDALSGQRLMPIPLAPADIAGTLNLRGRIVTAVDLGRRLGLAGPEPDATVNGATVKGLVVPQGRALYGLIVERLGEVLSLPDEARVPIPPNLPGRLDAYAVDLYRLEAGLLVLLDAARLLETGSESLKEAS